MNAIPLNVLIIRSAKISPRHSVFRRSFLALLVSLAALTFLPAIRAQLVPAPDGFYDGENTAEGKDALFHLDTALGLRNTAVGYKALFTTTGSGFNTAIGNSALFSNTSGNSNTAAGVNALFNNTTGTSNTAVGKDALEDNTTGNENTAAGDSALRSNTIGERNTAIGFEALSTLTTANFNTAVGHRSLFNNTDGSFNTGIGVTVLFSNTTGSNNTAIGGQALSSNTTGNGNTATGLDALGHNTEGAANTAAGEAVLLNNTTGHNNTGVGRNALYNNSTGSFNTAIGVGSLVSNTTGSNNIALGPDALVGNTTGNFNTATGVEALAGNTTGKFNIAIGRRAGFNLTTGNRNIDIGHRGVAGEEKTTRIGNIQTRAFIAGIRGTTTSKGNAVPVVIDSDGQLGTVSSSRRFKDNIKPMGEGSEAILGLQPVTFNYKTDQSDTPQFGLIAEEVAKVNPDLVVRDDDRSIYTVRYEAVNAMLLNEFLKEHREMQELKSTVAEQQKQIQALADALQTNGKRVEEANNLPETVDR